MNIKTVDELIRNLSKYDGVKASRLLTEFYAKARFDISNNQFNSQYVDGKFDGGIDFYYSEDTTFFIFQTKFSENPSKVSSNDVENELNKLKNTLTKQNPNKKAAEFVNHLQREVKNRNSTLEIVWLTTNLFNHSLRLEIQETLNRWKKANNWSLNIDFVAIDKNVLDSVIYDIKYGYIPYTGKKSLKLLKGEWIESNWEETGIHSIVCSVNVNHILKWFASSQEIDKFLQKNVREFLGDTGKINKTLKKSYNDNPDWFWYKHNGLIIFADNLSIDKTQSKLILRNPQIVNGGQTVQSLFSAFDKNSRNDNNAKILLRIYKLPYEDTESYKRSIDIISALNTQNRILASDLRSTDPRQVRLERLLQKAEIDYIYFRKRSKNAKSSRFGITMTKLGLRYYVCKKNIPHIGVAGKVEEIFEEENRYNEVFNEKNIFNELTKNHPVINYVTCWSIDQTLPKVKSSLAKKYREIFKYSRWYVLAITYNFVTEWQKSKFKYGWQMWIDFVDSESFQKLIINFGKYSARVAYNIIPGDEEVRDFFKSRPATEKFKKKISKQIFNKEVKKALMNFRKEIE